MSIEEQLEIVESNIAEYGVCDITIEEYRYLKQKIRAEVIAEISKEMRLLYGNEYEKHIRTEVIQKVYDRIDEGVCLMCEHRHEDYKCINDCNKNGWERETIMKWLKEQNK